MVEINEPFKPPADLLEAIKFSRTCVEMVLPTLSDHHTQREGYSFLLPMVSGAIRDYYGNRLPRLLEPVRFEYTTRGMGEWGLQLYEMVNNAARHGNHWDPTKRVRFGLWLGENGVLAAFRDEGDFYSREETKQMVESREDHEGESTRFDYIDGKPDSGGEGLSLLYEQADLIRVYPEQNALYIGFWADHLFQDPLPLSKKELLKAINDLQS